MSTETTTGGITVISHPDATSNSYASIADAIAQWALDPHKQDAPTDEDAIARALLTATSQINLEYGLDFNGKLYDSALALFFPRTGLKDSRGIDITDYTIFPDELILATIDQAYYANQDDRTADATASLSAVSEQSLEGVGTIKYLSATDQKIASYVPTIKEEVTQYLKPFLKSSASGGFIQVMSRG